MKRILLVEDESDLLGILDVVLSDAGYEVVQKQSAEDALRFCEDQVPDMIVSDIKMGAMDGFTMFEQMKTIPRLQRLPFIFISATADSSWMTKAKKLGATAYFTKPFDVDEVLQTIQMSIPSAGEKIPKPSA
jgi:CheY-like chemotaxis protein